VKDPDTGVWSGGYRLPARFSQAAEAGSTAPATPPRRVGWADLLPLWADVVRDLAALYHVDLTDPGVIARPWPPIRQLVVGLPNEPASRVRAALTEGS
jgi:hypothetical protein